MTIGSLQGVCKLTACWYDLLRLFASLEWLIRRMGLISPKPSIVPER